MHRKIPVLCCFCDSEGNCSSRYIYYTRRELLEEYVTQLLREKHLIQDCEFVKFKSINKGGKK